MITKEDLITYIEDRQSKVPYKEFKPIFRIGVMTTIDEEVYPTGKHSGFPKDCPDDIGFYYDFDTAYRAITENWCDIWETCYDYAFLMVRFPGLYEDAGPESRMLFQYDTIKDQYIQIEEPTWFKHVGF